MRELKLICLVAVFWAFCSVQFTLVFSQAVAQTQSHEKVEGKSDNKIGPPADVLDAAQKQQVNDSVERALEWLLTPRTKTDRGLRRAISPTTSSAIVIRQPCVCYL